MAFEVLACYHELELTPRVFFQFFVLSRSSADKGWLYLKSRSLKIFVGLESSIHSWKKRFFFLQSSAPWGFNTQWREVNPALENKKRTLSPGEEKVYQGLNALITEQGPFKIGGLLEEQVLINAGLSRAHVKDPDSFMAPRVDLSLVKAVAARQMAAKAKAASASSSACQSAPSTPQSQGRGKAPGEPPAVGSRGRVMVLEKTVDPAPESAPPSSSQPLVVSVEDDPVQPTKAGGKRKVRPEDQDDTPLSKRAAARQSRNSQGSWAWLRKKPLEVQLREIARLYNKALSLLRRMLLQHWRSRAANLKP